MGKAFSMVATMSIGVVVTIILVLCSEILPDSPFQQFCSIGDFSEYLKFVFYFVPVAQIIAVMEAWVSAITMWYTFSFVYRIVQPMLTSLTSGGTSLMPSGGTGLKPKL